MQTYLEPTQESGRDFFMRGITGPVVMLNLLRFRPIADYSRTPQLAPKEPISGEQAYRLYFEHTLPHLEASGGKVLFFGRGGKYLIGPSSEEWDMVMLIQQDSTVSFMAFASNQAYLAGIGHRIAALSDSRLLPMVAE
jgi:virulence-associated protein VagC